ncbi:FAD-binding domain-containing protein [Apiospora rasikravindrae]|uniref:FAD-binding domain-containing protein n=1 Tax=Apiospora rasikravindrae TaxID=990691 RepID=A0ABR1TES1_9PEZI
MIFSLPFTALTGLVLIFADPAIAAGIVDNHKSDLCSVAARRFPNRVSFPGSTEYENQKGSYYIAQARALAPDCLFRPTSTREVSDFVKLATAHDPCHQQRGNCSVSKPLFSMRGGGHTLWAGAAGAAGGLTVDLRGLNAVTLSADKKMASVGGGSNFADVYPQLVPHNLTVLGGRTPGVAAGGLHNGDAALYKQLIQIWEEGITAIKSMQGLRSQFYLQPSPVTNGTNSLGVPAGAADLVSASITINWDEAADDSMATGAAKAMMARQQAVVRSAGLSAPFVYLNYADVSQDPIRTYGQDNVRRLWAASRKYDPQGLWQTRVQGYKLPKV